MHPSRQHLERSGSDVAVNVFSRETRSSGNELFARQSAHVVAFAAVACQRVHGVSPHPGVGIVEQQEHVVERVIAGETIDQDRRLHADLVVVGEQGLFDGWPGRRSQPQQFALCGLAPVWHNEIRQRCLDLLAQEQLVCSRRCRSPGLRSRLAHRRHARKRITPLRAISSRVTGSFDVRVPTTAGDEGDRVAFVNLGNSGLRVSRACLGAMNFGGDGAPCDEAEARRIIDEFLDAGNNFIDTANVYTGGQSEQVVGRAVASKRDSVVIATKGRGAQGTGPNDSGLSRVHLTRALDASLRRLGTDYVDLYQCHSWDPQTPIEETMATLDGFVRSGKVRYIGCSNFTGSQIVEAQWAAERIGGTKFISLQPRYSLLARDIEGDVLPAAQRHGLGTMIYSPLAGGVLTGKYERDAEPPPDSRLGRRGAGRARGVLTDRTFAVVDAVEKVAARLDTTPTAVSLAWVLGRRGVTSVIMGPRTADQLRQNLPGFDLTLADDVVHELNEVSRPAR